MKETNGQKSVKPIAIWLLVGIAMLMIQVVLGGITRLTGSGLSITEWDPIMGFLPPLNEHDWQIAFDKYKQIGQYKQLNFDFTLSDFKAIFFWEWFHRLWARLIAVAFVIPFVIFLVQKRFRKNMILPFLILFAGGALQGAIGWIMVKSGLNENDVRVSHIRLAGHFMGALLLISYAVWFALQLLVPAKEQVSQPRLKSFSTWIIALLGLQLLYGAFMAGLKAGVYAPTWPTMNGEWIPSSTTGSLINDPLNVQFIHRTLAYLLTILVIAWWGKARSVNSGRWFSMARHFPLVVVMLQLTLGIFTVLYSPFRDHLLWLGALHQFTAMLLLVSLLWVRFLLQAERQPAS